MEMFENYVMKKMCISCNNNCGVSKLLNLKHFWKGEKRIKTV